MWAGPREEPLAREGRAEGVSSTLGAGLKGGPWARRRGHKAGPYGGSIRRGGLREAGPLRARAEPEPRPGKPSVSTWSSVGSGNQPGPGGAWSDRQGETVAPETGGGPWHLANRTTPQSLGEEADQILPYMLGPQEVWGTLAKVPTPAHRLHFSHPWHQRR